MSSLQEIAQTAWDAETNQEDKKAPKPLRAAFSRRYHMLQRMIGECIKSKHVIQDAGEAVEWAISLDPAKDPEKAFKRVKALRTQIRDMLGEFPGLDQFRLCDEELGTLTMEDFKPETRNKTAPVKPQVVKPAPVEPVVEDASEPESVSDLLDDALRDIEAAA